MRKILSKRKQATLLTLVLALWVSLIVVAVTAAQTGSGFDLTWHVVGSGGGTMTGSGFELNGTVGQSAVSTASGSGDTVHQGFWQDFMALIRAFLPMTAKH